jgi:hypothetical protein
LPPWDLFVVPTVSFDLLYAFVIVRLDRRDLVWINVTAHPTAEWVARQITEAFPWDEAPHYLIRESRPDLCGRLVPDAHGAQSARDDAASADFSPGSANRCDQFARHPGRTSSPLHPRLSCRYTQVEPQGSPYPDHWHKADV